MNDLSTIAYTALEYFLVYSFLGWCTEVVFQAVAKGIVVNRGFLNGPVCPIYGFGVIAVFLMLEKAGDGALKDQNALMVFVFGFVLSTAIELIGGWALDKIFHARWWDYSKRPLNLHGYICLEFSIIWGLGILLVVRGVNPTIMHVLSLIPTNVGWVFIGIFSAAFVADVIVSVMVMAGLNKRMAEIDEMRERMRVVSNNLSERLGGRALETAQQVGEARVQASLARSDAREQVALARADAKEQAALAKVEAMAQIDAMRADYEEKKREFEARRRELADSIYRSRYFGTGRLLRAFPDMQHREHAELLKALRESISRGSEKEEEASQ